MQISSSINKKNLNEITIKSLIWNSIIEVFLHEKKMDIKHYLVSIQLRWNSILVKINKPIIKTELLLIQDKIMIESQNKFRKVGIKFYDYEIKYIV